MSKLAIIFPREGPKSLNKAMVDISINTTPLILGKTSFLLQTCLEAIYANCGDFLFIFKL